MNPGAQNALIGFVVVLILGVIAVLVSVRRTLEKPPQLAPEPVPFPAFLALSAIEIINLAQRELIHAGLMHSPQYRFLMHAGDHVAKQQEQEFRGSIGYEAPAEPQATESNERQCSIVRVSPRKSCNE